jgi:hypothetical protein
MVANPAQEDGLVNDAPILDHPAEAAANQQQEQNLLNGHAAVHGGPQAANEEEQFLDGLLEDNAAFNFPPPADNIPADQLTVLLETALARQKNEILSAVRDQLSTISSTPFATIKRKADQFSNDGLKKQFAPLEEAKLRLDAVRNTMAGVAEGTSSSALGKDEAAQAVKTMDEGISHIQKRMHFLEVAQVEGWDVAKCLEKNALFLDLPEDMQKQLKRAKKDAKMEEGDKKGKKNQNKRGFHFRRGGGRGRGGFHQQSRGGF